MNRIAAVGFDLFNTLVTVAPPTLDKALERLVGALAGSGISVDHRAFLSAHREAAIRFLRESRQHGRETHNRYWIAAALESQGHDIHPEDPRIAEAVEAYFSPFLDYCRLLPQTREMLQALKKRYLLGLLSNFTHAPAAHQILDRLGLRPFFHTILISGDLGFRKPHPLVFHRLVESLAADPEHILYVGDDPDSDVMGARRAGLRPVWNTLVRDQQVPHAPGVSGVLTEMSHSGVPRISAWRELIHLIDSPERGASGGEAGS